MDLCPILLLNTSSSSLSIITLLGHLHSFSIFSSLPPFTLTQPFIISFIQVHSQCNPYFHPSLPFTPDSSAVAPTLPDSTPNSATVCLEFTTFCLHWAQFSPPYSLWAMWMTFIPSSFASQQPVTHLPLTFTYIPSHPAQHYLHLCTSSHPSGLIHTGIPGHPWKTAVHCHYLIPACLSFTFCHSPSLIVSPLNINLVHVFTSYHRFMLFCPLCTPFFPLCPTLPPFTHTFLPNSLLFTHTVPHKSSFTHTVILRIDINANTLSTPFTFTTFNDSIHSQSAPIWTLCHLNCVSFSYHLLSLSHNFRLGHSLIHSYFLTMSHATHIHCCSFTSIP